MSDDDIILAKLAGVPVFCIDRKYEYDDQCWMIELSNGYGIVEENDDCTYNLFFYPWSLGDIQIKSYINEFELHEELLVYESLFE